MISRNDLAVLLVSYLLLLYIIAFKTELLFGPELAYRWPDERVGPKLRFHCIRDSNLKTSVANWKFYNKGKAQQGTETLREGVINPLHCKHYVHYLISGHSFFSSANGFLYLRENWRALCSGPVGCFHLIRRRCLEDRHRRNIRPLIQVTDEEMFFEN